MVCRPARGKRGGELCDADGPLQPAHGAVGLGDEPEVGAEGVPGADGGRGGLEEVEPERKLSFFLLLVVVVVVGEEGEEEVFFFFFQGQGFFCSLSLWRRLNFQEKKAQQH